MLLQIVSLVQDMGLSSCCMFRYVQSLHPAHLIVWRESQSEERRIKKRRIWVLMIRLKSGQHRVCGFYSDTFSPTTAHPLCSTHMLRSHHSDRHRLKVNPSSKKRNANNPNIHSHLPYICALFFQKMEAVVNTRMQEIIPNYIGEHE